MSILHPKASSFFFFFQNPYKINTIFLRVFKAYFSFTKTFYVGYPCGSELKTLFLAVLRLYFDGLLCKIKITSSKNKFYILNKTILCIFKKKKKNRLNWPQEKLSKLTGGKSSLKTAQKNSFKHLIFYQSTLRASKQPKKQFSAQCNSDIQHRRFWLN